MKLCCATLVLVFVVLQTTDANVASVQRSTAITSWLGAGIRQSALKSWVDSAIPIYQQGETEHSINARLLKPWKPDDDILKVRWNQVQSGADSDAMNIFENNMNKAAEPKRGSAKAFNQSDFTASPEYSEQYETDSELSDMKEQTDSKGRKVQETSGNLRTQRRNNQIKKLHNPFPIRRNASHRSKSKPHHQTVQTKSNQILTKKLYPNVSCGSSSHITASSGLLEMWESNQLALAEANSTIVQLNKELKDCKLELKTVQRQYKMQAVRLDKAIGQEADMPQIIDRLNSEVRTLQLRLREKTLQSSADQRKISELLHRVYLLEKSTCDDKQNQSFDNGSLQSRKKSNKSENATSELDEEKKKNSKLKHEIYVLTKNFKQQINSTNEKLRCLREKYQILEKSLQEKSLQLQEKSKLLELQNVYSQRIPKHIVLSHLQSSSTQAPPPPAAVNDVDKQYNRDNNNLSNDFFKDLQNKLSTSSKHSFNTTATTNTTDNPVSSKSFLPKINSKSICSHDDGDDSHGDNDDVINDKSLIKVVNSHDSGKLLSKSKSISSQSNSHDDEHGNKKSEKFENSKKINRVSSTSSSKDEKILDDNKENSCGESVLKNAINGDHVQLNKENKPLNRIEIKQPNQEQSLPAAVHEYTSLMTNQNDTPILQTCKSFHEDEIFKPIPVNLKSEKYEFSENDYNLKTKKDKSGIQEVDKTVGMKQNTKMKENSTKKNVDINHNCDGDDDNGETQQKLRLLQTLQQVEKEEKTKQNQKLNLFSTSPQQVVSNEKDDLIKNTFGKAREQELWNDLFGPKKHSDGADVEWMVNSSSKTNSNPPMNNLNKLNSFNTNTNINNDKQTMNDSNLNNNKHTRSFTVKKPSWLTPSNKRSNESNEIKKPNSFTFIQSKSSNNSNNNNQKLNLSKTPVSQINDDSDLEELHI
ncbi:unnamed protein product [Trichobilharzia szidati]|nr:unnamed protein product [Trichobilharzia szidati]